MPVGPQENWNGGAGDDPHVGSVMLAPDLLSFIGIFALLEAGCREVWLTQSHSVIGIERDDLPDQVETFKHVHTNDLVRRFGYAGTAGDRNQHMMTGRIV